MNPNPRSQPVEVCLGMSVTEKHTVVRPTETGFEMLVDDVVVAKSKSAISLSHWAFDNGALSVKHDYDLRFTR